MLNGNALRGMVPATWPTSMTRLHVKYNQELTGKISWELVLQCSRGILYLKDHMEALVQQVVLLAHITKLIGSMCCVMGPLEARLVGGKTFEFRGVTYAVNHSLGKVDSVW